MEPEDPTPPKIEILSVAEKLKGDEEPDLESFIVQGVDEVWTGVEKQFILTASPKNRGPVKKYLGGRWTVRISYNFDGAAMIPVTVERVGLDSAIFYYTFNNLGDFRIWVDVSSIPVKGSPFRLSVQWGSTSQITKWQNIESFMKADHQSVTLASLKAMLELFNKAVESKDYSAVDYRRHILDYSKNVEQTDEIKEIQRRARRCVVIKTIGSIVDDFPEIEAIFVSHNSWMEWPKEQGYQGKILSRLSEKEKAILLGKCSEFAKSKLTYGSTLIFPVSNLALPGQDVNAKKLVNTVTVVFKSREKLTKQPYYHTKYENLKTSIDLSLSEMDNKKIQHALLPHMISKNYYTGGKKNEDAVSSIVEEWVQKHPDTGIQTLVIVSKDQTPRPPRKKRGGSRLVTSRSREKN